MSVNEYTIGEQLNLTASFTDPDSGAYVDPTTVVAYVRKPDGTILTPAPSRISPGVYVITQLLDIQGLWRWRANGEGAVIAASSPDQGLFLVRPPSF